MNKLAYELGKKEALYSFSEDKKVSPLAAAIPYIGPWISAFQSEEGEGLPAFLYPTLGGIGGASLGSGIGELTSPVSFKEQAKARSAVGGVDGLMSLRKMRNEKDFMSKAHRLSDVAKKVKDLSKVEDATKVLEAVGKHRAKWLLPSMLLGSLGAYGGAKLFNQRYE